DLTVAANTTLTIGTAATVGANVLAENGPLNKLGTGTLVLAGNNTGTTGVTTILAGIVNVQSASALGTATNKVIVGTGTSLLVQQITNATITTLANPVAVIGSGASGTTGAIEMLGG